MADGALATQEEAMLAQDPPKAPETPLGQSSVDTNSAAVYMSSQKTGMNKPTASSPDKLLGSTIPDHNTDSPPTPRSYNLLGSTTPQTLGSSAAQSQNLLSSTTPEISQTPAPTAKSPDNTEAGRFLEVKPNLLMKSGMVRRPPGWVDDDEEEDSDWG